jgi:hypothetical protein
MVLAAPFLLTGGAGIKVYKRIGRAFSRKAAEGLVEESGADFFFGVLVSEGSPVVGKSILTAGLRNLDGQYVTSVRRGDQLIHAVGPEFILVAGDILYLSGEQPLRCNEGLRREGWRGRGCAPCNGG